MINNLENILKEFSLGENSGLNEEIKFNFYTKRIMIAVLTVAIPILFIFLKIPLDTAIKFGTLIYIVFVSCIVFFMNHLIKNVYTKTYFLEEISNVFEYTTTLKKEDLIDIINLLEEYNDDLLKQNISIKPFKDLVLTYGEEELNMNEEDFINFQKISNKKSKNPVCYDKGFLYKYLLKERFNKKDKDVEEYLKRELLENLNNNMFSVEETINIYINNKKENDFVIDIIKKSNIYNLIKSDLDFISLKTGG